MDRTRFPVPAQQKLTTVVSDRARRQSQKLTLAHHSATEITAPARPDGYPTPNSWQASAVVRADQQRPIHG